MWMPDNDRAAVDLRLVRRAHEIAVLVLVRIVVDLLLCLLEYLAHLHGDGPCKTSPVDADARHCLLHKRRSLWQAHSSPPHLGRTRSRNGSIELLFGRDRNALDNRAGRGVHVHDAPLLDDDALYHWKKKRRGGCVNS